MPNRLLICPVDLALLMEGSAGLKDKRLIRVKMTRKKSMIPYISLRIRLFLAADCWLLVTGVWSPGSFFRLTVHDGIGCKVYGIG